MRLVTGLLSAVQAGLAPYLPLPGLAASERSPFTGDENDRTMRKVLISAP
jgi:hypothetical protein